MATTKKSGRPAASTHQATAAEPRPAQTNSYIDAFLTSEVALKRRYQKNARQMAFGGSTRAEAVAWQKKARKRFAQLLGLDHFAACPSKATKTASVELDGLTREEWRIQTERDVWMPYYLFVPHQRREKRTPLVLCPHGHASAGKWATGGRSDIEGMKATVEEYNYDYGVQLARAGFITACPDARGFGERREPAHQNDADNPLAIFGNSCWPLTLAGAPLGLTVQGMWTWDLMQLLDHLSEDKRIDGDRVGCAGLSGGGLQTLDLAALDTRIKAAVVSGYFYGVQESLQVLNTNCACNLVPHLWEDFDMGDIGAMVAPRGLFIETGDQDPLNGASKLANVRSQVKISQSVYNTVKAPEKLQHHVFEGEHRWDGTRAIPWMVQQLNPENSLHGD